ncbi:MAG: FHA domain-containing protein [Acidobacteria bacterium]|nr:FHA domain-containing protein [Acidobacteriota bacterium]
MADRTKNKSDKLSTDWLLRGVLTKVGDAFDRLTGRSYRPSSSLATSELIEKLKKLLDHEVRNGKFVPHNIKLKMQWDKFSTDSDETLRILENELKVAVIDHINDFRYHTYAPINLQIKPDYFTEGIKLLVSFDKFTEDESEVAVNVTVPQVRVGDYIPELPETPVPAPLTERFIAHFSAAGKTKSVELEFRGNQRLSVGRGGENDLVIDDASVSKIHASLVVNSEGHLAVADTGSTNGTFVGGNRIAYGKAIPVGEEGNLKFGTIPVRLEHLPNPEREMMMDAPTEEFEISFTENGPVTAVSETPTRIEILKKIEPPRPEPGATQAVLEPLRPTPEIPRPASEPPRTAPEPPRPASEPPRTAPEIPRPVPEPPRTAPEPPRTAPEPPRPASEPPRPVPEAEPAEPTVDRIILDFDQKD